MTPSAPSPFGLLYIPLIDLDSMSEAFHLEPLRMCKPSYGKFQVGLLEAFEDNDPVYYTNQGARAVAQRLSDVDLSSTDFYTRAWGVWDIDSGVLCAIYFRGLEYTAEY